MTLIYRKNRINKIVKNWKFKKSSRLNGGKKIKG